MKNIRQQTNFAYCSQIRRPNFTVPTTLKIQITHVGRPPANNSLDSLWSYLSASHLSLLNWTGGRTEGDTMGASNKSWKIIIMVSFVRGGNSKFRVKSYWIHYLLREIMGGLSEKLLVVCMISARNIKRKHKMGDTILHKIIKFILIKIEVKDRDRRTSFF